MRFFWILPLAALTWVACGDTVNSAAPAPAAAPKPVVRAVPDAGVVDAAPYLYAYNPIGKRDPFRSVHLEDSRTATSTTAETQSETTCDEPLCQADLDELGLVAVISGDANPLAMVEDHSGVGHIVRRNTKMGKQGGKVTSILRDCIVVTSFVRGPDGRAQPNRQNMCVRKETRQQPVLDLMVGKLRE